METFTFYDKDTGDLIQTGSANDFSLSSQTTRAIAAFDLMGPSVVAPLNLDHDISNDKLYMPNQSLPGKPQLNFDISPISSAVYHSPTDFYVSQSSAAFASIEVASTPCPKKPRVLAPTHFYVPHECFVSLKAGIDHCLTQRSELVFSSFPTKHMWKCKYLEGSQSREMHVHCFWDNARKSHLVEVKRVHGDGLFPQYTDLTTVLRQGLLPPPLVPTDTKNLRPVPCMPPSLLSKTQTLKAECPSASITGTAFRETLQTLNDMAQNAYYEPRLEAVKMLCDTMLRPVSHTFWQPNSNNIVGEDGYISIQTLLLETLYLFLRDSYTPVMEFGVVATHALLDRCPSARSWLMAFKNGVLVESLIKHIRNCDKSTEAGHEDHGEEEFYQYAHMRRLAGKAVNLIIMDACTKCCGDYNNNANNDQGKSMCKEHRRTLMARILQRAGYFSREHWLEYISGLEDLVLRESILSVQDCY